MAVGLQAGGALDDDFDLEMYPPSVELKLGERADQTSTELPTERPSSSDADGSTDGSASEGRSVDGSELDADPSLAISGADLARLPDGAGARLMQRLARKTVMVGEEFCEAADQDDEEDDHEKGHDHHGKPPSILTAVVSAVINFLLMFGLNCAYGMIMFEDEWNARHRGLGVKVNLATSLIAGLSLSFFSKVPVAIGGPDLNPVVFLGMLAQTIAKEVAIKNGLEDVYPEGYVACPGQPKMNFCEGGVFTTSSSVAPDDLGGFTDAAEYSAACDLYHEEVRATVLFAVSATSAMLGLSFFILGRFKLTRYLSFIPQHIMEAFLACIGYKVFKYALKFCKYEPRQFLPAAFVGVPLYFVKALHLGNPAVVIPLMLLIPLGIYYVIVFGPVQEDLDGMRKQKWMFEEIENVNFWSPWEHGMYMSWDKISFPAFTAALGDLPIMLIVCTLDCSLKVFSTDTKLPVKTDKDYEVKLYGATNVLTSLCGSSVGYMQLKFNVINYGVMGNAVDRRAGCIYALLCGLCFFWTTDPFNYLPRFFLSTLLFFAGAGFLVENLWGSRKFLSVMEWLQLLAVIGCFVLTGSLLVAIVIGGLMAACTFVLQISKVSALIGNEPQMGDRINAHVRRPPADELCMRHLSRHWLLVARLKGFIFFGSAQTLSEAITRRMEGQSDNPLLALRFIVMDFTVVDGLDASAAKCLLKVAKAANERGIRILWCGVNSSTVLRLNNSGTIQSQRDLFEDLGLALAFVEQKILGYILHLQKSWLRLSPGLAVYHGLLSQQVAFEPFQDVLTSDASRCGCPWKFCGKVRLRKYETILWKPGECSDLFLVHTGRVGLFTSVPKEPDEAWGHLVATYERSSFLNRGAVGMQGANTYWAVALDDGEALSWNQTQLHMMENEQPAMAAALQRAVLTQETQDARYESTGPHSIPTILQAASDANQTTPWLPGSLQRLEAGVSTTRWLCELGLLGTVTPTNAHPTAAVATSCPPLPRTLVDVLRIAFHTFSENDSLGAAAARAALKYAGLHDCVLVEEESEQVLTEAEFLELASEVAMKWLSEPQEVMLRSLFIEQASMNPESQADARLSGGSATITRAKLLEFFEARIGKGQSVEEVMGVANVWMADQRDCLNADVFVGIMSRIAKLHCKYWHVTDGVDKLAKAGGSSGAGPKGGITAEMLVAASQEHSEQLDIEKAQEMVTMAGFIDHDGDTDSCDVFEVAAFVSTLLNPADKRLPPKPKIVKASLIQEELPNRTRSKSKMAHPWTRDDTQLDPSMFVGEDECVRGSQSGMIKRTFSMDSRVFGQELPEEKDNCAFKLHAFLEKPESSRIARIFSLFMAMMIVCSVVTLVFEPLISPGSDIPQSEKDIWFTMDGFFSVLFTVELILRFAVADAAGKQTHWEFVKAPLNIADVAAVLPWYIEVVTRGDPGSDQRLLRVARLMRLARVVRLGRLARKWAVLAPIAVVFVVIWGIFLKNGLSSAC